MQAFEQAFRQWTQTNANPASTANAKRLRNNALVQAISDIQIQYAKENEP